MPSKEVERCRFAGPPGENYGRFVIKLGAFRFRCVVSCGRGWDHVSVSLDNRCPTWNEMDQIKRLFWDDHEVVMQLHVNDPDTKVNKHPFCLHLWKPQSKEEHDQRTKEALESGESFPPGWFDVPTPSPIPMPERGLV